MRPDVALAFDRMAAPRAPTAWRCSSPRPFAPTPSRRGCSPPTPIPSGSRRRGRSLHRLATELDLGPPSAYGWLAANAERFHFVQRYSWEPWHYGFTLNAGSSSVGYRNEGDGASSGDAAGLRAGALRAGDRAGGAALERVGRAAGRAALRGVALQPVRALAGRGAGDRAVHARARRPATACPTRSTPTARSTRRPTSCATCCAPSARSRWRSPPTTPAPSPSAPAAASRRSPRPQAYVADILGLLHGAGDPNGDGAGALEVRLVR